MNLKERKEIELEFRDLLSQYFNDVPSICDHHYVNTRRINKLSNGKEPRHNYQRDRVAYDNPSELRYNSRTVAILKRRPHKEITVFNTYNQNRYVQKLLERVMDTYFREVRLRTVDHE